MHLTLKKEATKPASFNFLQQQERFDKFIGVYNLERPHQALGGAYPGDRFNDALFENPGSGNSWIGILLTGTQSNRSAIGARIKITIEGRPAPIDASSGLLGVIILVEVSKALIVALPTVGGVVSLGAALVLLRRALALVIRGKRTKGRVVLRSPSDLGADEENAIVCIAYSDREGNARCFRPNVRLSFLGLGLGAEVGVIFSSASSGRAVIDRFPCVWGPGLMVLAFSLAALTAGTLGIDFFYGLT